MEPVAKRERAVVVEPQPLGRGKPRETVGRVEASAVPLHLTVDDEVRALRRHVVKQRVARLRAQIRRAAVGDNVGGRRAWVPRAACTAAVMRLLLLETAAVYRGRSTR